MIDLEHLYGDLLHDLGEAITRRTVIEHGDNLIVRLEEDEELVRDLRRRIITLLMAGALDMADVACLQLYAGTDCARLKTEFLVQRAAFQAGNRNVHRTASHEKAAQLRVVAYLNAIIAAIPGDIGRILQNDANDEE